MYCSEVDGAACLTAHQWSTAETVASLLAPFEECTRETSSDAARISLVIPLVAILRNILQRESSDDGVKTMKSALLQSVTERFANLHQVALYTVSTLLDPRFKQKFFKDNELTPVKASVLLASSSVSSRPTLTTTSSLEESSPVSEQPPAKKPRLENSQKSVLWDCLEEMIGQSSSDEQQQPTTSIDSELGQYLSEPVIGRTEDPLLW